MKTSGLFLAASIVASIATLAIAASQNPDLRPRPSPSPATTNSVPHVQIGVEPNPELTNELLGKVSSMPNVELRDTVISLPGAVGFWLAEGVGVARPETIVGGREFAHMHPDGSLHASLHPALARNAVEAGWATMHPWSQTRPGWEGFVMIYTPSTREELDTVYRLVEASYAFVLRCQS